MSDPTSDPTNDRFRRAAGRALGVVSFVALALVVVNLVGTLVDNDVLDLPGPGLIYVAILVASSAGSSALLKEH